MNTRLQQFLSENNISQSQFAQTLGVTTASVSHIMSGRNRPGYEFIVSVALHYPQLSLEWLLLGKEPMYKSQGMELFPPAVDDIPDSIPPTIENSAAEQTPAQNTPPAQRTASRVLVLYDDNTYQELG